MPNPKQDNLIKVNIMLDRSDYAQLREIFRPTIGVSKAVRIAIRRMLIEIEGKTRRIIDNNANSGE